MRAAESETQLRELRGRGEHTRRRGMIIINHGVHNLFLFLSFSSQEIAINCRQLREQNWGARSCAILFKAHIGCKLAPSG